ncbi:MAG: hypothetical protein H6716_24125 [Polyangiaceae bacterium]|nr:hypothetical protein [Polyangiaceae bacterium]MCB9609702.1 hypothetical protein [Polyangiaceae bacterium]MCB9628150.1 hypothetical protein [Sandaracinaceae bacterium]
MSDTESLPDDVRVVLDRLRQADALPAAVDETLAAVLQRVEAQLDNLPVLPELPRGLLDDDWGS